MERALSFGSVAATYERFRPGYPDQLVDTVLAYAGTPVRTALEIGAGTGTGKATRVFAARGIAVTATDPDAAMLAELRRHVPSTVTTRQASFEELPTSRAYDLVFAAASLHWTSPAAERRRVRRPPVDDLGVPPALPRGPRARAGPDPGTCCRRRPPSTAT
jgi:SAM-dependent methyltransferase